MHLSTRRARPLGGSQAREAVRTFAELDEAILRERFVHRDDLEKLIAEPHRYTEELERLFERDAKGI